MPTILAGAPQTVLFDPVSAPAPIAIDVALDRQIAHDRFLPQVLFIVRVTPCDATTCNAANTTITNVMADACVTDLTTTAAPRGVCFDLPAPAASRTRSTKPAPLP